jgi:hypothetical protein
MHFLFLALQLALTPVADTTVDSFPYSIKASPKFDWKEYELKVDARYKDSVINSLKKFYPFYFDSEYAEKKAYPKAFHFVHLNGDELPDLVYEGWTGAEGNMVQLYINRQHKMEQVFRDYQHILHWQFTNNCLQSFVLFNSGCCAETVMFERHYTVDASWRCKLILQRAILLGMSVYDNKHTSPEKYFDQPVFFKTTTDEYALRYSPEITNEAPEAIDFDSTKGNIIALYPKGSKGKAWGYKKDNTGREWWLVEMDPRPRLSYKMFYDYDEKPTWYFGWMSSKYLEKVK